MKSMRPPDLHALTGLRFVAAALVVIYHYRFGALGQSAPLHMIAALNILNQGNLGVSFFFILSGFILFYVYAGTGETKPLDRHRFWRARVARIYPIYVIGLLLGSIPYFWYYSSVAPGPLCIGFLSLTLLQSWVPTSSNTWNGPAYTLSDEAFFYALFPRIRTWVHRLPTHRFMFALFSCWVGLLITPVLLGLACLLIAHGVGNPFGGDAHNLFTREPPLRLPEFVAGVILGALFIRHSNQRSEQGRKKEPGWWGDVIVGGMLGAVASALAIPLVLPNFVAPYIVVDPFFALLIYAIARYNSAITRLLSTRLFVLLGNASYALYITHYPLLYILGGLWTHSLTFPVKNPLFLPAYLALAIGLSVMLHIKVETPMRNAIMEFSLIHRVRTVPERAP